MRCSARRSRAAATISIARVIFWMFLTAEMRLRTSRCEVAMGQSVSGRGRGQTGRLFPALAVALAVIVGLRAAPRLGCVTLLDRVALLVEVVPEVLGVGVDGLVERRLGLIGPIAAGDLLEQLGLVAAQRVGQAAEELLHLVHDDAVQVAIGGGVD